MKLSSNREHKNVAAQRRDLKQRGREFLRLLREEHENRYDPLDDLAKSIKFAFDTIRERKAAGGPGWIHHEK